MKKIISLLSFLTITGPATPLVVATASYEKSDESKLENLHRVKRGSNTNKKPTTNRASTAPDEDNNRPSTSVSTTSRCKNSGGGRGNKKCRKPNEDNSVRTGTTARERILGKIKNHSNNIFKQTNNEYKDFLRESINYFQETKNIVRETTNPDTGKPIFKIKKHNVEDSYKKIPLNIEGNKVDLILNKKNLYVDGIITHNNGDGTEKKLWYFPDSNLAKNIISLESEDKYKLFSKIVDLQINSDTDLNKLVGLLKFESNYNVLKAGREDKITINKSNIREAIINLSEINDNKLAEIKKDDETEKKLKNDFLITIFTTAEATRFFSVRDEVKKVLASSDTNPYEITWKDHKDTLTNWDKNSQKYYKMKDNTELQLKTTSEEKKSIYNVAVLAVKDEEKIRDNQRG